MQRKALIFQSIISLLSVIAGCFVIWNAAALAADSDPDETRKVPYFAMLASPEVNLRTGPGTRYPIDWVIKRKGLPVEVVQEFEHWRKVQTPDGTAGWAHKVMLNHYRSLVIKGLEPQNLYAKPDRESRVQARVEPDVIGRLERCQHDWCQAKIQGFDGWLPKTTFWGVYKDETFDK